MEERWRATDGERERERERCGFTEKIEAESSSEGGRVSQRRGRRRRFEREEADRSRENGEK